MAASNFSSTPISSPVRQPSPTEIVPHMRSCFCVRYLSAFWYLQDRLQSVLNAAARLVYSRRMSEHTTPLLRDLHWRSAFRSESTSGCVFWHTTVYTVQHRHIWLTAGGWHRCRCSSPSAFCRLPDDAGAVNPSINSRRPVAAARAWNSQPPQTRAASSLLTFWRESTSRLFSSVIWLMWRSHRWLTVKLPVPVACNYLC